MGKLETGLEMAACGTMIERAKPWAFLPISTALVDVSFVIA